MSQLTWLTGQNASAPVKVPKPTPSQGSTDENLNGAWCRLFHTQQECGGREGSPLGISDFKPYQKMKALENQIAQAMPNQNI